MKKFAGLALGVGALLTPVTARAQTEMCGPASIHVCVTADFRLSAGNNLDVYLFNGSATNSSANWQSVLTGFGVYNLSSAFGNWTLAGVTFYQAGTPTILTFCSGPSCAANFNGWKFDVAQNSIIAGLDAGASQKGNNGIVTCDGPTGTGHYMTCDRDPLFSGASDYLLFRFHYDGATQAASALSTLDWGFKVQSVEGYGGGSYECVSGPTDGKYCAPDDPGTPQDIVPEPATMSLLAMGLAGMAAASRRRRKK